MTVAICIEMPPPPELPELSIPQFGILQAARQSLYDLPDMSVYIMSLQTAAAAALAPLRRFLEMVEIIFAIKNCTQAVIEALLPPSPEPIINCIKDLIKAIARIASFFPPFEYIKTMMSLARYCSQIIDEVVDLFVLLDEKISDLKENLLIAEELGDIDLGAIVDCAGNQYGNLIINAMDILKFITPILTILLEPLARLVPVPALSKMVRQLADLPGLVDEIQTQIEGAQGPPVLGSLLQILNMVSGICVTLYNVLAPLVGRDPDMEYSTVPVLENF
jgi:hypothetical protein